MTLNVRPAAVAGTFYPDKPATLDESVRMMLETAGRTALPPVKAIIAPHAGYIYSGPIAASIYAPLRRQHASIKRVVLLGPTHRVPIDGLAAPRCQAFSTPLGDIPIDRAGIDALADLPQVRLNDAAHAQEHSLEVQLPFLIETIDQFSLIPLTVGRASAAEVGEVIERLWGGDETLIVVSSDLSHYLPYDSAIALDSKTAQSISIFDASITHEQACGATPINGLLHAARQRRLQARLIDLRNSGDTAGDRTRVVGYAAFAFFQSPAERTDHAG